MRGHRYLLGQGEYAPDHLLLGALSIRLVGIDILDAAKRFGGP